MYKRINTYTHIQSYIYIYIHWYLFFKTERDYMFVYFGALFLLTLPTANTLDLLKAEDAIWEAQRSGLMICFPLLQTYRFARSLDKRISQDVKLIFTSEMIEKNKRERESETKELQKCYMKNRLIKSLEWRCIDHEALKALEGTFTMPPGGLYGGSLYPGYAKFEPWPDSDYKTVAK